MKNKKTVITALVAVLVVGTGVGVFALRKDNSQNNQSVNTSNGAQQAAVEKPKSDSQKFLEQYTGDEFDRIFIANMIEHHSGAVEMANLAAQNAKHEELKAMGSEIISAQNKEIEQMKNWQQAWGYPASSGGEMMDHSAMGMTGEMDAMTQQLEGKSGDEFDKVFIKQMIEHHESAVAMSRPAERNAGHQEIKNLAKDIISAQTREIDQMRQWQSQWGYGS